MFTETLKRQEVKKKREEEPESVLDALANGEPYDGKS